MGGLQALREMERDSPRQNPFDVLQITQTNSGSDPYFVGGVGTPALHGYGYSLTTGTVANVASVSVITYATTGEVYDPDFVARVLAADAAPIAATFDNVVDLLDWLERD
jgi:hypothetical protein